LLLKRLVYEICSRIREQMKTRFSPGAGISELESRIQERALLGQLEMRKVLTPEQVKLLPPCSAPVVLMAQDARLASRNGKGIEAMGLIPKESERKKPWSFVPCTS